jgi:alkaline phosphatase
MPRRSFLKGGLLAAASAALLPAGRAGAQTSPAILSTGKTRNVIFCVSDGMSAGVLGLAEEYSGHTRGKGTHWVRLARTPGTISGLMDTASLNSLVTDSAAASSAWGSGVRVNNGALNVSPDGRHHQPLGPYFKNAGRKFGVVTSATVTHATPAGFAVCQGSRSEENEIAEGYLGLVDVALGGGKTFFDPSQRPDKRDLWQEARGQGYSVCLTREELLQAAGAGKLLGTFSNSHLPYVIDRPNSPGIAGKIPTLAEMTRVAIESLNQEKRGFLLQIEGARVDHAAHHNDIATLLKEQLDFDDAVGVALEFAANSGDTLVVVTSDHGNANPGLNGMGPAYGGSSQTFEQVAKARESFHSLFLWAQGRLTRPEGLGIPEWSARVREGLGILPSNEEAAALLQCVKEEPFANWNRQLANFWGLMGQVTGNHTGIGWTGITHTADPTILHATGPGASEFAGLIRNDAVCPTILGLT